MGTCCMDFCERHRTLTEDALKARGLECLIAPTADVAASRVQSQAESGLKRANFDSRIYAIERIAENCLHWLLSPGSRIHMHALPETFCPLCLVQSNHDQECKEKTCAFSSDEWRARAADDCFNKAIELGAVAQA